MLLMERRTLGYVRDSVIVFERVPATLELMGSSITLAIVVKVFWFMAQSLPSAAKAKPAPISD